MLVSKCPHTGQDRLNLYSIETDDRKSDWADLYLDAQRYALKSLLQTAATGYSSTFTHPHVRWFYVYKHFIRMCIGNSPIVEDCVWYVDCYKYR